MSDNTDQLRQIQSQTLMEEKSLLLRHARSPLHILVVDDDPVTLQLLQSLLGPSYSVTVCSTVHQAVHEYLRVMPDLVFLDINLGDAEFSGFDVAYTVCMHDPNANIVMLTAHESPQNIAHATRAGALGFLVKPFGASRILHYVQECERAKFSKGSTSWS